MAALYLKAALVVAISLLAFILVTKAAWPSNVMLFKAFAAWCRTLPDKWRRLRDPVHRRRMEAADRYEQVFGGLAVLVAQRASYQRQLADAKGEFGERVLGAFIEEADAKIEGMRLIAVEVMRTLDEETIGAIADRLNATTFDGRASRDEIAAFLADERSLIVETSHHAAGHARRLIRRFAHLAPSAAEASS